MPKRIVEYVSVDENGKPSFTHQETYSNAYCSIISTSIDGKVSEPTVIQHRKPKIISYREK